MLALAVEQGTAQETWLQATNVNKRGRGPQTASRLKADIPHCQPDCHLRPEPAIKEERPVSPAVQFAEDPVPDFVNCEPSSLPYETN